MFSEFKQSTSIRFPVRMLDAAGAAVTGIASGSVTATILKGDGTTASITINGTTTSWTEVSTGAFSGKGVYTFVLGDTYTNVIGQNVIAFNGGTGTAVIDFTVVANVEADTYGRIGAPAGASVSADIAAVKVDVGTVTTNLATVDTNVDDIETAVGGLGGTPPVAPFTVAVTINGTAGGEIGVPKPSDFVVGANVNIYSDTQPGIEGDVIAVTATTIRFRRRGQIGAGSTSLAAYLVADNAKVTCTQNNAI